MRLLTDRRLRLLWTASSIASLGAWLLVLAVPLEVFRLTGSPAATGLALAVEVLPAAVVGPWAGVLVDRLPRKRILVAAYLGAAAGVAIMLAGHLVAIYTGVLVEAVAVAFLIPALCAVAPGIAGTEADLATLNAAMSFARSAFRMIGPPAGTLLAAHGHFGAVVAIDVAGYVAAAVLIGRLSIARGETGAPPPRVLEGVRLVGRTPMLRGLMATSWLFLAANAGVTALLVPFVAERLRAPSQAVGLLVSGLGAGYLVGSAVSKPLLDRCRTRTVLTCAYAAVGGGFLVLFNAPTFAVALGAIAVCGVPGAILGVVIVHRMQTATPDRARGRVAAAFFASDATATLAGAVAAPVAVAHLALGTALNAFSGAVLIAAVAAAVLIPRPDVRGSVLNVDEDDVRSGPAVGVLEVTAAHQAHLVASGCDLQAEAVTEVTLEVVELHDALDHRLAVAGDGDRTGRGAAGGVEDGRQLGVPGHRHDLVVGAAELLDVDQAAARQGGAEPERNPRVRR